MSLLKMSAVLAIAGLLWGCGAAQAAEPRSDAYRRLLKEASLALLKDGNARFVDGQTQHPNQDSSRRVNTATDGQEPFATVLACSDSRLPVEVLFDRGVGDLFVVRVAGNVAGDTEIATVEYGVGHLSTPLLVVLGHSGCGAVSAVATGAELHGHLPQLATHIRPAVSKMRAEGVKTNELVARVVEANVWQTISELLRESDIIRQAVTNRTVQVVGAVYDMPSGRVKWLGTHPEQDSIITNADKPIVELDPTPTHAAVTESAPSTAPPPSSPRRLTRRLPAANEYLLPDKPKASSE
jgi:carbonic anhydrase